MIEVVLPKILQPFRCDDLLRLGKDHDGGYLVNPRDIEKTNRLIALGIGDDWSFENEFIARHSCELDAYDKTVDTTTDQYGSFFKDLIRHTAKNVGRDPEEIDFSEIVNDGHSLFLKCDIEGQEYKLLDDVIKSADQFVGMIFEFHEINNPANFDALTNFISKVKHKLVHLHVNNYFYYKTDNGCIPDILELTFTSSDNISYDPEKVLPHPMDMTNNPNDDEFKIYFGSKSRS